jgi:hypothetical protein
MSAYKQFLSSDIIVTPFEVNKSFTFTGANQLTGSIVGIDRFIGTNLSGTLFNPNTDPTTGQVSTQYQRLIYSSIQELYYSNYLSSSYGSPATTQSLFPGNNPEGNVYIGSSDSSGRYFNYNQTTLTFEKYFPTGSGSVIGVMSVPSKLYGNYIQPGSFIWNMVSGSVSGSIYDDANGNLILSSSGEICGQIFYPHGLAVITSDSNPGLNGYGSATYGSSLYGGGNVQITNAFVTSSNVTCSFSSSLTIYETQYKCTIRDNEYNFTLNPSISSGSTQISASNGTFFTPGQYLYSFATASYFNPYITTVGLYDDNQNLIAIGKLAQPLPLSPTTDTTILINLDR